MTGPEGDRLLRDAMVRAAVKKRSEPSAWTPEVWIAIGCLVVAAVLWGVLAAVMG